jgi:hypothetical protein
VVLDEFIDGDMPRQDPWRCQATGVAKGAIYIHFNARRRFEVSRIPLFEKTCAKISPRAIAVSWRAIAL